LSKEPSRQSVSGESKKSVDVTNKKRLRRSREEIIDRLLEAACQEFEKNGYAGTKTADIARKAGVAEPLIFNHFGSKAKLFHDAIFKPLDKHIVDFCSNHLILPGDSLLFREYSQQYILEMKQFLEQHSKMLMSLLVTETYSSENVQGLGQIQGLDDYFVRAAELTTPHLPPNPRIGPELISRLSFATLLGCVLFKNWLFPERFSEEELNAAIPNYVLGGLDANAIHGIQSLSDPRQEKPQKTERKSPSKQVSDKVKVQKSVKSSTVPATPKRNKGSTTGVGIK
jgi:AcrR family transcriptional regulator